MPGNRSPKCIFVRLILWILPWLALSIVELFVLPIDYFNFRLWEALRSFSTLRAFLPGPFYPNQHVERIEQGDLGYRTPWAVMRAVTWRTDEYGFRYEPRAQPTTVVLLGDSNVAGTGLSQEETIYAVLERALKAPVYPYGPANINHYLMDRRFRATPPAVLIFMPIERSLVGVVEPWSTRTLQSISVARQPFQVVQPLYDLAVLMDRSSKATTVNYIRARLAKPRTPEFIATDGSMLFLQGNAANTPHSTAEISALVGVLKQYRDRLARQGTRFLFVPVPNKETVYFDLLPSGLRPHLIPDLLGALKSEGLDVLDLQAEFERVRNLGQGMLYQTDDTHWGALAVRVAADAIAQHLRN